MYSNNASVLHLQAAADEIGAPDSFTLQGKFARGQSALAFKGNHKLGKGDFQPELQLGATHQLSSDTSVGALLTHDHNVFLRYSQKVSPLVSATLTTEVLKTKGQNLGFTLAFNP